MIYNRAPTLWGRWREPQEWGAEGRGEKQVSIPLVEEKPGLPACALSPWQWSGAEASQNPQRRGHLPLL